MLQFWDQKNIKLDLKKENLEKFMANKCTTF